MSRFPRPKEPDSRVQPFITYICTWVIGKGGRLGVKVCEGVGEGERAADGHHDLLVAVVGRHEVGHLS